MTAIIWALKILFFASVFLIFYTYVIFPAVLSMLAARKRKPETLYGGNRDFPDLSIIISVYNEEKVIREKIESIINSDYPKEKLEVIIGSDASDDNTADIVNSYVRQHAFIKFIEYRNRRGKPSVINDLVSHASHSILVLTDANVFFERQMLGFITRHFSDLKTGLVGSNILNVGIKKDGISLQEKSYIERENLIKYHEGLLWGCMMGPFGGCYAMRKELFVNVPPDFLVDDFYLSMKVIGKGYKCINDLEAICYEDVSNDIKQEYRRKSRISAGNFQNLRTFKSFLLKPFNPAGFCFISHKFLRWMTPFLILVSLFALLPLSLNDDLYLYLLCGEIFLICTPVFDWIVSKMGMHFRLLRFVSYFTFMNLALLKGFFRFAGGINSGVWTPTKRT